MSGFNMGGIVGAGTQPASEDGAELEYMEMPKAMRTYSAPALPEPDDAQGVEHALDILAKIRDAASAQRANDPPFAIDITDLDAQNRTFLDQALGDGEVSIVAGSTFQAQESVFAGVWRVQEYGVTGRIKHDCIEVGSFPSLVLDIAHQGTLEGSSHRGSLPPGVVNAAALATELDDKIAAHRPGAEAYVINLTLLPLSEEDVAFLDHRLGPGSVTVLSRGYGNCRITSTGTRNVWWVRYYNSRDTVVLNTIEIVDVPGVACAAPEDLADSAQRIEEILGVYR
ncbi:hydrogenase expression/formation protein [Hyphomicrobium sp. NDB2Meth4]|uniref:hydrogenase expression/formation protein n=1 Tax=Hyphomicrobium sp. NDB2Meth4 TaxID=1892846 RepID=UPI0009314075|nr:hydrogenase expression/formation protein [Hyphomicrobium sp. NDB2Meth4]